MTAYDEILAYNSKGKFNDFRQALVHTRGTLSAGVFSTSMSVLYTNSEIDESTETETSEARIPQKIYLRLGKYQQPGFVFDESGTDRALSNIANGGKLKLLEEFGNYLKFSFHEEKDNWLNAERQVKRRCIAKNIEELIKRTDVNYRTHGDRLHYYVVGLVTIKAGTITARYPLALFPCVELNKSTLEAEIETTGFLNFWLDRSFLENALMAATGSYEINLNDTFASTLNTIAGKLNSLQLSAFDEIHVDPTYSAVAIVTGFEPEYIDPAWEKIV